MRAASPALERFMDATVRLEGGTGVLVLNDSNTVIVTAEHVLPKGAGECPRVWTGSWSDCSVLTRDEASDVAVLSAPPSFDGRGIDLLEDRQLLPGEELWTCGFPLGWKNKDSPVLCRGIVAGVGVGPKHWANLEASWGNSGGALVAISGEEVLVGGIALGRAGAAHDELAEFRRKLEVSLDGHLENDAEVERSAAVQAETDRVVQLNRADFEKALAGGSLQGPDVDKIRAKVESLELEASVARGDLQSLQMIQRIHKMLPGFTALVADFIDDHFRTGFISYASASAVRKLLGRG